MSCGCGFDDVYPGWPACNTCIDNCKVATCIDCSRVVSVFPFHDNYDDDWSEWVCNPCIGVNEKNNVDHIEVVHAHQSTICPITRGDLVGTPAKKSTVCGHVYSADGIRQYLEMHKGKTMCPVSGCNRRIRPTFLVETTVKQSRAKKKQKIIVIVIDEDSE